MDLGLAGRVAIVTGASRGIGRAVAELLVNEGCRVLAVSRTPTEGPGESFAIDVTRPDAGEAIVNECLKRFGQIDIVVNNVGLAEPRRFSELTADDWRRSFDINFFSAVAVSSAAVPVMAARGWGRLVHVASVSGREPDPSFAPYSAAKAALLNWSKSLSHAHAAQGVLSNCVVPGVTLTEMVSDNAEAAATKSGKSAEEIMAKQLAAHRVAVGRFGEPHEIASAVLFLASEQAAWITGAALEVDGGTLRSV